MTTKIFNNPFDVKKYYTQEVDLSGVESNDVIAKYGKTDVIYNTKATVNKITNSFNIEEVNNSGMLIGRNMYISTTATLTFPRPLIQGEDAPPAFPLLNCISDLRMFLNGISTNIECNDLINVLSHFSCEESNLFSYTPTELDNCQWYDPDLKDSHLNPLRSAKSRINGLKSPRASHIKSIVYNQSTNTTTVVLELRDPIILDPFMYGDPNRSAVANVTKFKIEGSIAADYKARIWKSTNPNGAPTNVKFGHFKLHYETFYPPSDLSIPDMCFYPYHLFNLEKVNRSYNITSPQLNSIVLNTIPSSIIIFCRDNNSNRSNPNYPDRYLAIESVSIRIDGKTVLNTATSLDLYQISRKNGYCGTYNDFICQPEVHTYPEVTPGTITVGKNRKGMGSIIKLNTSTDFLGNVPGGMKHSGQMNITLTLHDNNKSFVNPVDGTLSTDDYEMCVLFIFAGAYVISDNTYPMIDLIDLNNLSTAEPLMFNHFLYDNKEYLTGGGFGSFVKNTAKSIKKGYQVYKKIAPILKAVAPEAAKLDAQFQGTVDAISNAMKGGMRMGGSRGGRKTINVNDLKNY